MLHAKSWPYTARLYQNMTAAEVQVGAPAHEAACASPYAVAPIRDGKCEEELKDHDVESYHIMLQGDMDPCRHLPASCPSAHSPCPAAPSTRPPPCCA